MKTTTSIILVVMLTGCVSTRLNPDADQITATYELVLTQILKEAQPQRAFSIALLANHKDRQVIPFDLAVQTRILHSANIDTKLFVPPGDVRIPEAGELLPSDPTGKQIRGVESLATGQDIDLYSIEGLRMTAPGIAEVYYMIYSTPLAARAGSYKVRISSHGITVIERVPGWES